MKGSLVFFPFVLAVAGLVDAMSWMVVTPSLIFYVRDELGSTKQWYGIALSCFSFSSFLFKPVWGRLSDAYGFRLPFLISFGVATLGGICYFGASKATTETFSVLLLVVSRLMGGVGGANSALGYAYMARAIPLEQQTGMNTILSFMRILGMSLGPFLNAFLAKIPSPNSFGLTPYNSVGWLVALLNFLSMVIIYLFLPEIAKSPKHHHHHHHHHPPSNELSRDASPATMSFRGKFQILEAFFQIQILVPFVCTFVYNANFQLVETAFAPAAHHALGWGTVQTSSVLGSLSIMIAICMGLVYVLSQKYRVTDESLMGTGLVLGAVASFCLYTMWDDHDAVAWHFWFPVAAAGAAYPFLAAPTVSVFTKHVEFSPVLRAHHGTMQAILGMAASVAGFVTPSFVASMVLRHAEQVEASSDGRELTPWALYAPVLSTIVFLGLSYVRCVQKPLDDPERLLAYQSAVELHQSIRGVDPNVVDVAMELHHSLRGVDLGVVDVAKELQQSIRGVVLGVVDESTPLTSSLPDDEDDEDDEDDSFRSNRFVAASFSGFGNNRYAPSSVSGQLSPELDWMTSTARIRFLQMGNNLFQDTTAPNPTLGRNRFINDVEEVRQRSRALSERNGKVFSPSFARNYTPKK